MRDGADHPRRRRGGAEPFADAIAATPASGIAPQAAPLPQSRAHDADLDEVEIEIDDGAARARPRGGRGERGAREPRDDDRSEDRAADRDDRNDRDDDGGPRRRREPDDRDLGFSRPRASPWEKARIGMLVAFIGLCVMAGAHGIGILGALLGMVAPGAGLAVARIAAFFTFVGTIGAIVGHVFCLFVSNRNNLFAYAVATVAVAGFYVLMQMVRLVLLFNPYSGAAAFVMLLVALVEAAHFVLIAFFLRSLAQQLDDPGLEKSTFLPMVLAGAYGAYALLTGVIVMSLEGAIDVGRGFYIVVGLLRLLGAGLVVAVFVFTLLAVYRGKQLVDRA